jgi:hypothetical protein
MDPSSTSAHEPPDERPPGDGPLPQDRSALKTKSAMTPRIWAIVLTATVVAGLGSWLIVEGLLQAYKAEFQPRSRPYPTVEDIARINKARTVCGTIAFGATASLLGLMLGLAGGLSRHSIKAAALSGLAGLLLGGILEAGAAWISLKIIYTKLDNEDMLQTLLSHEALWVVPGLVSGLALGLGLGGKGRWARTAIGGLIGAVLATVVYEFVGALVFPTAGTHQPIAEWVATRALAQILIPLGAAVGAVLWAREPKPRARRDS